VNHSRAQDLLSAYLENDLSESERVAVESHLDACTGCSDDLRDLREAVSFLRRLPAPEPPPFLASRVMARIADGEAQPGGFWRWLSQASTPVIAAPLAAAAAALAVFALVGPRVEGGAETQIAAARRPAGPLVNQFTGPVGRAPERSAVLASLPVAPPARSVVLPALLARQLRGAGHPYSAELAGHFDGPDEAVAVSWTSR